MRPAAEAGLTLLAEAANPYMRPVLKSLYIDTYPTHTPTHISLDSRVNPLSNTGQITGPSR